ncbi:hypothetical protein FHS19_001398 [Paenibacillus rhizosphaerae]|uniref:SLH domain-containing protein n=1 Tax=Paenibacillus rhizosphaerae TaxID=297318 RepID=A0A839TJ34_9BACL|nr:S-layer homology domain-containing protein [Paenibacillus rhizosphaerae]MBB3126744.1 hypothetical protein [Paenibacillus rhizosphaerae]
MNKHANKLAGLMLAAALGTAALPIGAAHAAGDSSTLAAGDISQAVNQLSRLHIMQGYEDGSLAVGQPVTRAELAKLLALAFSLQGTDQAQEEFTDVDPQAWFSKYAAEVAAQGIMQSNDGRFEPRGTVTKTELVQMVTKALKRDAKSVEYWAERLDSGSVPVTRGEAAFLLDTAHRAIPSDKATITSLRSLNAITLIVTFDAPLTADKEVFTKAKEDFAFTGGLTLTNLPRLKTGSIATYIVPTSVQQPGFQYSLTYRGANAGTFTGNGEKLNMTETRQVTNDTFELESLQANGVVDYGYVISAYSAGRGADAFVLDGNNRANGVTYQIISSGQAREVTITPEGGQPMVAKYVPFTQSTDGRQEPKFRLPEGKTLTPGVTYTVTSDWAQIERPSFVAQSIAPLDIIGAEAMSDTSIAVTLSEDPGDELFSGRSVELTNAEGHKLTATYKYSSRKGAVGIFDLAPDSKLVKGTAYTVTPVGEWAGSSRTQLTAD